MQSHLNIGSTEKINTKQVYIVELINGKYYIGSSLDLSKRLRTYYSLANMNSKLEKSNSIIYLSLLKYKISSFSLEILEYCDKNELISREQYYIDSLEPEYNILKTSCFT